MNCWPTEEMIRRRFDGCEIVQLKSDHPDYSLDAGDCGVIWGVYGFPPLTYEATFINKLGEEIDMPFAEEDVKELHSLSKAQFPKALQEIQSLLNQSISRRNPK